MFNNIYCTSGISLATFRRRSVVDKAYFGCWHCTQIMLGNLMTCLDTLSAVLLELQDVSVFVEEFLVPHPWSLCCLVVTAVSMQEGGWAETFFRNHYLSPPFFYRFFSRIPDIVWLYKQQLIFVFSHLFYSCWLLLLTRPSHFLVMTYIFFFQLFRIAHSSFIWIGEWNLVAVAVAVSGNFQS